MATGSTPHRISRRLRLGFCDSPQDRVIAPGSAGVPPASLAHISHRGRAQRSL